MHGRGKVIPSEIKIHLNVDSCRVRGGMRWWEVPLSEQIDFEQPFSSLSAQGSSSGLEKFLTLRSCAQPKAVTKSDWQNQINMAGSDNLNRDSQSLRIKYHSESHTDTKTRRALRVNETEQILAKNRLTEQKACT